MKNQAIMCAVICGVLFSPTGALSQETTAELKAHADLAKINADLAKVQLDTAAFRPISTSRTFPPQVRISAVTSRLSGGQFSDAAGDGDGYGIRSSSDQEDVRYTEVQTTVGGTGTPFFWTEDEIAMSQNLNARYCLCRPFKFAEAPKDYILHRTSTLSGPLVPADTPRFPSRGYND